MNGNVMTRMSGEELFLLKVVHGSAFESDIDAELDRRALNGWQRPQAKRRKAMRRTGFHRGVA